MADAKQYGVLLLNMGGPAAQSEVQRYIYNLLADPDMVRLPAGWLWQKPFAALIARRRAPKVRQRYGLIGGQSPLGATTARQAALLKAELGLPVAYAMRYTPPRCREAVADLRHAGTARLIVLPLYPQYSTVSTLSALKDFQSQVAGKLEWRVVDRHFNDPGYIQAMQHALRQTLAGTQPGLKSHLLFVAHSIPEAYIRRGDPYAGEVEQTAALVRAGVADRLPSSLAYSSSVGPVKWRGPSLEVELQNLVRAGIEQVIVQPLSFVAENLETLYDLDIVFKQQCATAGIKAYHRVPTVGASALYISALAGLARRLIESWDSASA